MVELDEKDIIAIAVAGATLFGIVLTTIVSLIGMLASRKSAFHASQVDRAVNQIDPDGQTIYALVNKNDQEIALMSKLLGVHIDEQAGDSQQLRQLAERFEEHDKWEKDLRKGKYGNPPTE